jgi:hypothetical protein
MVDAGEPARPRPHPGGDGSGLLPGLRLEHERRVDVDDYRGVDFDGARPGGRRSVDDNLLGGPGDLGHDGRRCVVDDHRQAGDDH